MVAEIYYHVTHQLGALSPASAFHIAFRVTGRKHLHYAYTVARLGILFPCRNMHPTEEIGIMVNEHTVRIVAHPWRNRQADTRPLVTCALRIAFHLQHAVVKPYHAVSETGFAETCTCHNLVGSLTVNQQRCLHVVKIAVTPAPKMKVVYGV